MIGQYSRSLLSLTLGALVPVGCASLPQSAVSPAASAPAERPVHADLPSAQAGQLCLAAAQALEESGHEAEAIAEYERARQKDPHLTQVSRKLAVLCDRAGQDERALAEYLVALQANPKDADLLNDLGFFYEQRGDAKQAEAWLRKAVAADPGHRRAWVNLGVVLGEQARFDESYEAFARVLRPAEARSNVGMLLAKQGRRDEARQSLRKALAEQPDLPAARAALKVLDDLAVGSAAATPDASSGAARPTLLPPA